ncbi:type III secretion protein [Salmonella enterica]|nr:protein EsaK [Salmonella enterica subsp. enterica serovar Sandiego]EEC0251385.1 protein EsaK [Salmonella enterica subsp. enterica]EJW2128697.1 type III secretion protein [Salmonella enterica]EEE4266580.1 protein EsaK [Salmonella enterica subsp. enterica serovar Sandiego]EKT1704589.1 type III secretion protein [Salmonella enterica]
MNNPLNLVIRTLPGPCPQERLTRDLQAEREQIHQRLAEILDQGREEASALRSEGEACLAQAKEEASRLIEAAKIEAKELVLKARVSAAEEAVQWLYDELEMEQRIANELSQRWRNLIAQSLDELLGQQDQNALLLRRIEKRVTELLPSGRVTLILPPTAMASAIDRWKDITEVTLQVDSTLSEAQAILDNGLVRIHLDNFAQQASLFELLSK